jgi:hypothetical protein
MWSEREAQVSENLQALAETEFPDNAGLGWRVLSFEHREKFLVAELEPERDEAGASRFKFVLTFKEKGAMDHIATYGLKDGRFTLLSSTRAATRLKLPRTW